MTDFADYLVHGWKLCPIPAGSKGPTANGWNTKERAATQPHQLAGSPNAGLLHAYSGTCALDIDNMTEARPFLAAQGVDVDALLAAKDAVMIVSGRRNRAKLLYRLASPLPSKKLCRYEDLVDGKKYHALELRCAARGGASVQDVLPPSIHPDTGKPYEWRYGDELAGSWRNLPTIPDCLLKLWVETDAETDTPAVNGGPAGLTLETSGTAPEASIAELAGYLEYHDPDGAYDDWLAVGMALHDATGGSPEGLALWDAWSRKGQKYGEAKGDAAPQYPADKWSSFHVGNGFTIGYLKSKAPAPLEAFPVVAEEFQATPEKPERGKDTRPGAIVREALSPLIFISNQGLYYDTGRHSFLSMQSVEHLYTPLMPVVHTVGSNGAAKSYQPNPVHELRRATWKEEVTGLRMHPGEQRIFTEHGQRFLNTYENPNIEPLAPTARELEAFNFMWSRPDEAIFRDWLKQFFSHAVQKPGVKIRMAPLLVGHATGSGKNTLMKILPQLLFTPRYVTTMTSDVLQDKYSDQLMDAWWVYFEELHSGSVKGERISLFNRIKPWITDDTFTVRPMYGKAFVAPNRVQILASSNYEDDAVHVEDSDRRMVIGHIENSMTDREATDLYQFLDSPRAPGVLQHIFRETSLAGFNPNGRAPSTAAKRVMVRVNYGHWETELLDMIARGAPPFDKDLIDLTDLLPYIKSAGITSARLGRVIRRPPFNFHVFPTAYGNRLHAWRNVEYWKEASGSVRQMYYTGQQPRPEFPGASDALPAALAEACGIEAEEAVCDLV